MDRARLVATCRTMLGALCSIAGLPAWAGGGPETTLLVVNARSPLSLAVANEYVRLRDLPERQVLWLNDVPPLETIDVDTFRMRILEPIRAHLSHNGLADEIDLIAYSAGFPYAVTLQDDLRRHGLKPNPYRGDTGSLTGLTFFARQVASGEVAYLVPRASGYFRRRVSRPVASAVPGAYESARGFRSKYRWGEGAGSDRYVLSVMLGYAGAGGNSLPEIVGYLSGAAASDGTRPAGTVYLMENSDIRSRVRRPLFPATIAALQARGRKVAVLAERREGQNGREPVGKSDIVGLVAGTQTVNWRKAGSHFLPGAIAESFTSYGGHFSVGMQSKLTEFLRHGAAGSSGAVREPYAIVAKFPVPQLHVHYADGCSLAEAFYQSIASPYQLIVVGDPLARPFAHFAGVELEAAAGESRWQGTVELRPRVTAAAGRAIARVELWVDGRPLAVAPPGQALTLDTRGLPDGGHELRLVAVEAGAIETRSYMRHGFRVDNHGRWVELEVAPSAVPYGEALHLAGSAVDALRVSVRQGSRVLDRAAVTEGRWSARIASASLGIGTALVHVEAEYPDGSSARSVAHRVVVVDPFTVLPADRLPPAQPGLDAVVEGAGKAPTRGVVDGATGRPPRELRGGRLERVSLSGAFEVRERGLYELTVEARGRLSLMIGENWRHEVRIAAGDGGVRLPLALSRGWHRFRLIVEEADGAFPRAVLAGPEPPFVLAGKRVRRDVPDAQTTSRTLR